MRKELEKHSSDFANQHLSFMLGELKSTKLELKQTKEELTSTTEKLDFTTVKLEETSKTLNTLSEEKLKQSGLLKQLLLKDDCNTVVMECQYFRDMLLDVDEIEKTSEKKYRETLEKINNFDMQLELFNRGIEDTKEFYNDSDGILEAKGNHFLTRYREDASSVVMEQVSDNLQKYGLVLSKEDEVIVGIKIQDNRDVLLRKIQQATDGYPRSNFTFRERFAAVMNRCPENGIIMEGDKAVVKLRSNHNFNSEWCLKVNKSEEFFEYACVVNAINKNVEVGLPRLFYKAAVCEVNAFNMLELDFLKKTKRHQSFQFQDFNEKLPDYVLDGFILVVLSDKS